LTDHRANAATAADATTQAGTDSRLELDGLSKRYDGIVALDGLSFSVNAGHVFGFVGPNGAGKTTAMRIVLGVLAADSGEVRWHGRRLDEETRRRIGYMPEERGLYPKMRVAEQLAYLAELHGVEAAAARRSTDAWLKRLGIDGRAGDKVETLSLGNQQRVQLAAALVHEPDLLVLDEPFSGLDPVGVDVLSEVLLDVAHERGVPVVFSSHQLELVERICDAVAIINGGRLVASGGVEELRTRSSSNRWRVEVSGAEPGWANSLPGVRPDVDATFEIEPGGDNQALLDAARAAGDVIEFRRVVPTLAELFRHIVSTQPSTDTEPEAGN
jgi:ABC-2 type transport system ATP-binding protein